MFLETTFYLSRVLGKRVCSESGEVLGRIHDIVIDVESGKPLVFAYSLRKGGKQLNVDSSNITVTEVKGQYVFKCCKVNILKELKENTLFLREHVLDRQLVDINGRKLVRVNDLRLAVMSTGTFVVAVDVGTEGLLRRIGIAKPLQRLLNIFNASLPNKLILWDEVENIDIGHAGIKLSKPYSKLETLHVSDLADIIEDMDAKMQAEVFSSLNEEKAADVLEELETDARLKVIGSMPLERAADLLEKMPADEVADILEEMSEGKAEKLLSEMEREASDEVRKLMEYEDDEVGSVMTTDFISYNSSQTIEDVIEDLRKQKPEASSIYLLNVVDEGERLIASVTLRDLVVAEPHTRLDAIMDTKVIYVKDTDEIGSIAEIISKYNLLAVPVVDRGMVLLGMVIIDDVVYTLLKSRRRGIM